MQISRGFLLCICLKNREFLALCILIVATKNFFSCARVAPTRSPQTAAENKPIDKTEPVQTNEDSHELLFRQGRRPLVGVYYLNVFSDRFFQNPFKKPFSRAQALPETNKSFTVLPKDGVKEFWAGVYDLKYQTNTAIVDHFIDQGLDFSKLKPVVGYYDLADYETGGEALTAMEKHILQAHLGGLDFFNFYWYFNNMSWRETKATRPWCLPSSPQYPGIAKSENCHLSDILYNPDALESFVRSRNNENFKLKFMVSIYADHYMVNWDINESNLNDVLAHLGHLFKNPNYLKIGDRPVLFIGNGSGILVGIDAFIQALNDRVSPKPIVMVGPIHRGDNNSDEVAAVLATRYQSVIDAINVTSQYENNYIWKAQNMVSFGDLARFPFATTVTCERDSILCPLKKHLSRCEFGNSINNPNAVTTIEDFVGRVLKLTDTEVDGACAQLATLDPKWLALLKNYISAIKIKHFEDSLNSRYDFQAKFAHSGDEARALRVATKHDGYNCLWPTELGSDYAKNGAGEPLNNERYHNGRPTYQYFIDVEIDRYFKKWNADAAKPLAPCMALEVDERPELTTWKYHLDETKLRYFPDFSSQKFRAGLKKVRDWQLEQTSPLADIFSIYAWNEWQEGGRLEPNVRDHTAWLDLIQTVTRTVPLIRYTSQLIKGHRVTTLPLDKLPEGERWIKEIQWLVFDESKIGQNRIPIFECRSAEDAYFVSDSQDCEGAKKIGLLGYVLKVLPETPREGDYQNIWSRADWLVPLYRCLSQLPKTQYFLSSHADCEASKSDGNPTKISKIQGPPIGYAIGDFVENLRVPR